MFKSAGRRRSTTRSAGGNLPSPKASYYTTHSDASNCSEVRSGMPSLMKVSGVLLPDLNNNAVAGAALKEAGGTKNVSSAFTS